MSPTRNHCYVLDISVSRTADDEAQVGGAHLEAVLLQLGHVHLQTLVLPVQLVAHHSHFTCVQVVHDLF